MSSLPIHLSEAERRALMTFIPAVRALLGTDLQELILFGSRARGEGHRFSDLDVAVIVKDCAMEKRRAVQDLAWDISLEVGVQIAPMVKPVSRMAELRQQERLLATDIARDGVPL